MNSEFIPDQLGEAIFSWLNYMSYTADSNVLAESSVRYPLAEYIERKLHKKVLLEFKHPVVPQPDKGHPRMIDFVFSKNDETINETIGDNRIYMELKYLNSRYQNSNEQQRVFNDIVRLALVSTPTNECYFILCGPTDDFETYIKGEASIQINNNKPTYQVSLGKGCKNSGRRKKKPTVYSKWFGFKNDGKWKIIKKPKTQTNLKKYFNDFDREYNYNGAQKISSPITIPNTISTKLVYLMPDKTRSIIKKSMTVAIWQVCKQ